MFGLVVDAGRDPSTIDENRVAVDSDLTGIAAVDRVELEEVGRSDSVGLQVVDVGELNAVMAMMPRTASRPMRPKPLMPIRMVMGELPEDVTRMTLANPPHRTR